MKNSDQATRRKVVSLLLLALLAAAPYLVSLSYSFVYDDHGQIAENEFLRNKENVRRVLALETLSDTRIINGRRPLVVMTYFIDRALWHDRPAGYRLTNLLFHTGTVLLLYLLVIAITENGGRNLYAFVAGALFAVHPLLTEAVHVPAFRPDVLYTFFLLLYLLLAIYMNRFEGVKRGVMIMLGALVLCIALFSKEAAVVGPALLAGMWICFPGIRPKPAVIAVTLVIGILCVGGFMFMCSSGESFQALGSTWNGLSLRPPANLYTAPWIWALYLRIVAFPYPLIADRIVTPVDSWLSLKFAVGLLLLVWTVWLTVVSLKRRPWIAFGLGVMLAGFAPVSNLVPLFNPVAERYLYLLTVGFCLIVARTIAGEGLRTGRYPGLQQGVLGVLLVVYLCLGVLRLFDWRDDDTLWRRTLADEPRSARAHTWIGLGLKHQDRLTEALEHFAIAAQLNPYDVTPLVNRAIVFGQIGDVAEAERTLREAITIRPDKAAAHWNLSVALLLQGRDEEALIEIDETLKREPRHWPALKGKVVLLVGREDYQGALEAAERMAEIDPEDREAREAITFLRGKLGVR